MNIRVRYLIFQIMCLALFFGSHPLMAQIRSGLAFLKMLPGARLQSMAASQTGEIDDGHAIYANPGAIGFLRDWQWSASYTKWIADVYNASFLYGRKFNTPWTHNTHAALGILYQGVPRFDSSDHAAADATANDIVVALGIGQPLTVISRHLSLGSNIKYLRSTLDHYSASTWMADAGVTGRTTRFGLGNSFLEYGILSAGISVTHIGPDIKYLNVGTPLPQTWRTGASFYAGTHNGVQLQLAADFCQVKDEDGALGIGAEISWAHRISLNSGYNFGSDLLDRFSFGASIRLDDVNTSAKTILPGRNAALQFDLSTVDEGEFFARTYRGTVKHLPIGPESFRFIHPAMDDSLDSYSQITLKWDQSEDPDLYDDVAYTLLVERDSSKLADVISNYGSDPVNFLSRLTEKPCWVTQSLEADSFKLFNLDWGHYYWAVVAKDKDNHIVLAEIKNRKIAHFYVPYPDIEIEKIEFEYDSLITENDYHGILKVRINNSGDLAAGNFNVAVLDSAISPYQILPKIEQPVRETALINEVRFDSLLPGKHRVIQLPWHTKILGAHSIMALAYGEPSLKEKRDDNNAQSERFYTIPKGTVSIGDTVTTTWISQVSIDMPIITEVCFEENSTVVRPEYLHKTIFDPPVATLIERLNANRGLALSLQGYADTNSGETDVPLANARAEAVRDSMIHFGVEPQQIRILPGQVLAKRRVPSNPIDAKWVFEERRYVEITADSAAQQALYLPIHHVDQEIVIKPAVFDCQLKFAVSAMQGQVICRLKSLRDSVIVEDWGLKLSAERDIDWKIPKDQAAAWMDRNITYSFFLTDSLGRRFRTHENQFLCNQSVFERERRMCFPLKFAETDPTYAMYWERLFGLMKELLPNPNKRMFFMGHACAIGPEDINRRLSRERADRFPQDFMNYIAAHHDTFSQTIAQRLDAARGYGEDKPLAIVRLNGEEVLIGDNNQALGRKLNRRLEISFYTDEPWARKRR
jgi:outer membrane protein OmpA-like peptidoglycan-associated protein